MTDIWYLVLFLALVFLFSIWLVWLMLYGRYSAEEYDEHDGCDYDYGCCGGGAQEEWR